MGLLHFKIGKSPESQNVDRHPSDFMSRDASPGIDSRRSWKSDIPVMGFQVAVRGLGGCISNVDLHTGEPLSPGQPQLNPRVPADSGSLLFRIFVPW